MSRSNWRHAPCSPQFYVQGDPGNTRDFVWRNLRDDADRAAVTAAFVAGSDGLRANFPIVVAA